ncbi:LacI family DNA-binding transcriptional regulator [Arcanobacterium bovis]|uniref:LacI family DNA-binding transcriptional regulator n=1 Tax=Arcanobacterium bovis TaxID=2529275 RepID=A0A4Q9UZV9_9ACTO|nr:LacI family DNA-binding transcriptional regulator [Arcanobacterium bovis]TBW21583.1 LacI family DNA-binding transcriptional regulator [Arcanobacterium bovis]
MTGNRIRLSDVAERASVSPATVSRVLNGKNTVASSTRLSVLAALEELGYEAPPFLRERKDGSIGLILPELTNPIFPLFAQQLQMAMSVHGFTTLLGAYAASDPLEERYVDAMVDQHVAGIIFVSALHADRDADLDHYHRLISHNIPFVTINGRNPQLNAPDISTDDASAVNQALRYVISQGHRNIGLATGQLRFLPAHEKSQAFSAAMHSLLPDSPIYEANTLFTVEGGYAAAEQLVSQGCSAIICASDVMALGVIRYCHAHGLDVPNDVSVIGYDDSPFVAFTNPPLTTLRQPVKEMAEAAVSTLITRINNGSGSISSVRFAPELIVRNSTGPAQ